MRQWHEPLHTERGETLALGLFAACAKVSPLLDGTQPNRAPWTQS
jgi:hypothetical protein